MRAIDRAAIARGQRAKQVMDDPLVKELFEELETAMTNEWKLAATVEAREAAHAKLFGLLAFSTELRIQFERGQAEEAYEASQTTKG